MKKYKIPIIVILIILVSLCLLEYFDVGKYKGRKIEYTTITLEKEPDFICPSNGNELLIVMDGEIVAYDSKGKSRIIPTDIEVAEVYACDEWMWLIDVERNLYKLEKRYDGTYITSDVILTDVTYVKGSSIDTFAINSKGEIYAWGNNEDGTLGLGDVSYVEEPTKIDYIEDAICVERFYINKVILDSQGNVYAAGYVDADTYKSYLRTFEKVELPSKVNSLVYARRLFAFYEDGTMTVFDGLSVDSQGKVCITESSYVDEEFYEYEFEQINSCGLFTLALDSDGKLYYWGHDFMRKIRSKADYVEYSTPQEINFNKEIEEIYATYDAAFLKNGLEIYIITRQD